jgi:hypothetical protein
MSMYIHSRAEIKSTIVSVNRRFSSLITEPSYSVGNRLALLSSWLCTRQAPLP